MENIIQQHAILLKDKVRMEAYKKAIFSSVKEGDTVFDIGGGLGILSFLALKAGASHVHVVEVEPGTWTLLRLVAKHNGLAEKMTFHKGLSTKIRLKKRVDLIVSELFGNLCLNENLLPVLIDARKRLLKNGGSIIPSGMKVFFAPCENRDWEFTTTALHNLDGFDLLPDLPDIDVGTPSMIIKNADLLSEPRVFIDIDIIKARSETAANLVTFNVSRDGLLSGFASWFEARLTGKISFSTSPNDLTTHWKQGFLPLRTPQKVKAGQKIIFELEFSPDPSGLNSIMGYHFEVK
ncbi:MAG: hypothetical protein COV46_00685 [Deltaproteobacteria bacterium CG11_big_fil_rev_8_21_14_0_20_49_13]|nr:MAG: hypothetical protein COV46_00685 [Deltaproteobacteria bacterium CG11_big_fil_rev_8_21_14_0_20_49_13]